MVNSILKLAQQGATMPQRGFDSVAQNEHRTAVESVIYDCLNSSLLKCSSMVLF